MEAGTIPNFRQAAGIRNIYRCASLDVLGENILAVGSDTDTSTGENERFAMEQVGLVLDLRSPSERKEKFSRAWIKNAGMKVLDDSDQLAVLNRPKTSVERCVVRIDILPMSRFVQHIEENWLTRAERAQATRLKLVDRKKLCELMNEKFNAKGLFGYYEAILEQGKDEICRALRTITIHLEQDSGQSAIIHCAQGKDRTGMLVMLLQSVLGVSDADIVADYFKSNEMLAGEKDRASTAANEIRAPGTLDRKVFSGTNEQAMISTLQFLRGKYGSVSEYLDSIDFDQAWRNRLASVLIPTAKTSGRR